MRKLLIIIFLLFVSSSVSCAQETVSGVVYADENENMDRDSGEEGIPEVAVSNGREVVLTDGKGHFKLPLEEEAIIFITKPSRYDFPLNGNNLPQFYYVHHPEGSPQLEYPGVEPTGQLPESLDFGLIPTEKKKSFTAVAFGDPQPRNEEELSFYRDDVVAELSEIEADMALVLGDIMFDDLSLFDRYNQIMETLNMPVFNILGNHDINFDSDGSSNAKDTFKSYYGPTYFSFDYGEIHFIILDNINYMGYDEEGNAEYRGYLNNSQLKWIENDLQHVAEDKLIVLLAHIPLYSSDTNSKNTHTINRDELIELFKNRDRVLFIGGHRHMTFQHFLGDDFGRKNLESIHQVTTTAACGSLWGGPKNDHGIPIAMQWDGVPNGYHIFEFEGNTYRERYKAAGYDSNFQMRIESPIGQVPEEEVQKKELLVNVFNGSERSEVKFRINDSNEWYEMDPAEEKISPFYRSLHKKYEGHWSHPRETDHIWTANLPHLKKGVHKITVWTQDMYGQEFTESKIIEVE